MAKNKRGFNTPFAGLKQAAKQPAPKKTADPPRQPKTPAPSPDVLSDEELFRQAMFGMEGRGPAPERVEPAKRHRAEQPSEDETAVQELQALVAGDGQFHFSLEDSGELVQGRTAGVNTAQMNKLRRGELPFRRHLDLHGMNREEAHSELKRFILAARRDDERCVLVVTGRGNSSPGGLGVLREALPRWLGRAPIAAHVLAFTSAKRGDGGPGAFYVLLRRAGRRPYL